MNAAWWEAETRRILRALTSEGVDVTQRVTARALALRPSAPSSSVSDTLTATDGISPEDDEILQGIVERHSPTWLSDRIAELRARNGERINDPRKTPPSTTPTDTERLDFVDAFCEDVTFAHTPNPLKPVVVLTFAAADGGDSGMVRGADWRDAIDKALSASRSSGEG